MCQAQPVHLPSTSLHLLYPTKSIDRINEVYTKKERKKDKTKKNEAEPALPFPLSSFSSIYPPTLPTGPKSKLSLYLQFHQSDLFYSVSRTGPPYVAADGRMDGEGA